MTIALDETLIEMGISTLIKKGKYTEITDARVNGEDIGIGMMVCRHAETFPDIDLCAEIEALLGQVIGLNTSKHTLPDDGAWYNDYDNPFTDNYWVRVGVFEPQGIYLVLSDTNKTFAVGDKLKVVDGVLQKADTSDNYQFICEQAITGADSTRKYFYARFVKN